MQILRQSHVITPEMQIKYFNESVFPEYEKKNPDKFLVSILSDGELIGYAGLVHINWNVESAEISFLLKTELNSDLTIFKQNFSAFLSFIKKVAFFELKLNKLYTAAYDIRPYVYDILEANDFIFEARLLQSVKIDDVLYDEVRHCILKQHLTIDSGQA